MTVHSNKPGVKLRVILAEGVGVGPGKIALLQVIEETGSNCPGLSLLLSWEPSLVPNWASDGRGLKLCSVCSAPCSSSPLANFYFPER
jgi:hypothetical protein